jgi:hypothetical protein
LPRASRWIAVGLFLRLTERIDDAVNLLVSCGAIAVLCAEASRSLSFDVVALSLRALT